MYKKKGKSRVENGKSGNVLSKERGGGANLEVKLLRPVLRDGVENTLK